MNDHTPSLRPLRGVDDLVASLRSGVLDGTGTRRATLQVADAVELSMRYLLRDDERAPIPVRLRALAPVELNTAELLGELRRHDRISMELAASVHQLFETRRRLEHGSSVAGDDVSLALRVAERLESEILSPDQPALDDAPTELSPPSPSENWASTLHDVDDTVEPRERRPARTAWLAGAVAVLILLGAVFVFTRDGGGAEMERGIALFRSGSYADAASHFWRYAEANPDDATPHLYLARIHRRMGRMELAAQELEKAIGLAPEDADVQSELGFLLLDTRRADVAVERFRAAVRLDPESAGSWIGLVRALRESGRPDAAERVLIQAPAKVREMFNRQGGSAPRP